MGTGIPQGAVGASAGVLTFSLLCFLLALILICMLWSYGERWTYVTLLTIFSAISTLASIIQQIHYNCAWLIIKHNDYEIALKTVDNPALGLQGSGTTMDAILFLIQLYCYNVMSLNVLFWAVKLFCGSWEVRANFLGTWREHVSVISKVFGVVFPAIAIGVSRAPAILNHVILAFILSCVTIIVSMSAGSVLMILILYKYIKTRQLLFSHDKRNGWWGSSGTAIESTATATANDVVAARATRRSVYDRALIVRFSIGFVVLLIFEAVLILFSFSAVHSAQVLAASSSPDFSVSGAVSDILYFIPGVTTSLVIFLVFGTTKSLSQYKELVVSGCGRRRNFPMSKRRGVMEHQGDTEFERLPSLGTTMLTPEERTVLEAKMRGMIAPGSPGFEIGTVTTITAGKARGSQVQSRELNQKTRNFSTTSTERKGIERRKSILEDGPSAGSWAAQHDLEIGLALEDKWDRQRDSTGNTTSGNTTVNGDSDGISHRDFILDASD